MEPQPHSPDRRPPAGGHGKPPLISDADGARLIKAAGTLQTGPGGEYAKYNPRKNFAFFDPPKDVRGAGLMLIAESAQNDRDPKALHQYLVRRQIRFTICFVSQHLVDSIYDTRRTGTPLVGDAAASGPEGQVLNWIALAASESVSDIHVSTEGKNTVVEMRIDGLLYRKLEIGTEQAKSLMAVAFTMCDDKSDPSYVAAARHGGVITRRWKLPDNVSGVRCSWTPLTSSGRYLVMRLLYNHALDGQRLSDLGYLREQERLMALTRSTPNGMIVFSGPVGSGKSTAIALSLLEIRRESHGTLSIASLEEPVELKLPGVKQQVINNLSNGMTREEQMIDSLKNALRQDQNVLFIGETRDAETGNLGLHAARSGLQVWTSTHANFADQVPQKMRAMGMSEGDIYDSSVFLGYVNQRLVRRLCPHCRVSLPVALRRAEMDIDRGLAERIQRVLGDHSLAHAYAPGNDPRCEHCSGRGYKGRTAITEVIQPTEAYMQHYVGAISSKRARDHWLAEMDGISMMTHGLVNVLTGITSPMEVERLLGQIQLDVAHERLARIVDEEMRSRSEEKIAVAPLKPASGMAPGRTPQLVKG